MSETVSRGRDAAGQADALAAAEAEAARRRVPVRWAAAGLMLIVAGGLAAGWSAGAFSSGPSPGSAGLVPPATQPVTRQALSSQTPVTATLGYAGSYTVLGHGGTLTWLPSPGQVIHQGQVLYKTDNGSPVMLLYGSVPAWRTLDQGVTGADVSQLNHDLAALGDASSSQLSSAGWDDFSSATAAGVAKLQSALGISSPSGSLSQGSFAFEPSALRVATVTGSLGGPASGPVLTATTTQHVVTIALDASQQSEVNAGDPVSITLPDGSSTPGVVSSVGAVASGSGSNATIPVTVTLTDPSAGGNLDQAPVTVYITTGTVSGALVVPVAALLAQSSGGYAVEVLDTDNARRLVPVTVGVFDDADGLVQVTGALSPGERVVVPSI
jgi:multidrug efflux pump subunit AcrA (membrane-fusion protein)